MMNILLRRMYLVQWEEEIIDEIYEQIVTNIQFESSLYKYYLWTHKQPSTSVQMAFFIR